MSTRSQQLLQFIRRFASASTPVSDGELLARFARFRDEDAFAELVRRHGSMVLGVCRRVLRDVHRAEDAFQATFLVLARKAATLRNPDALAAWLHGVARHLSLKCHRAETRRRRHEAVGRSGASLAQGQEPLDELTARELLLVLDEELQRLPEVYRLPLILCGMEGMTLEEAARRLGWSSGSVKGRLLRGRKRLHARLRRRGLELSAGLLVLAALREVVPPILAAATVEAALGFAASAWKAGVSVSVPVAALVQDLLRGMRLAKLKLGLNLLLLAGTLAAGGGVMLRSQPAAKQATASAAGKDPDSARTDPAENSPPRGALARLGTTRFRSDRPIDDARFSADGKRLVACAGSILYVWKTGDGSLLRRIDTKLELLDDPTKFGKKELAFAVHPKESRVACGGVKDGRTYLQIWNFESGEIVAEKASSCDALKLLAWTPDGKRLLERANVGWGNPTGWKLIVRDDKLAVVRTIDLPIKFGEWSTVMLPLPDNKQAILWQNQRQPTLFDLQSGATVRTIELKSEIPSDLGISADGKTLAATSTNAICLLNADTWKKHKDLPVLRGGWEKPRPLFSPDGKTIYVWDHRPIAYDVATGKEKWKSAFRTTHTVRVKLCDISKDGATLLMKKGHALALVDAKTGAERDTATAPAVPTDTVWSPDSRTLFTRKVGNDRTWTAWEAATGKRLYDLQPTGFVNGEDWKMLPDLFFIKGGKEIAACVEKVESTERVGPKEFLIFDAATGQCQRRLGKPLPDRESDFRWMHPIGVDGDGATVLMQAFAISAGAGPRYATVRWDPIRQIKLQEWTVEGERMERPRYYAPYDVLIKQSIPNLGNDGGKVEASKIRCYSLTDGKTAHELKTDFPCAELDRVQGNFLLSIGYESKWIKRRNTHTYTPQPPYAYDLWELPSRKKIRVFELKKRDRAAIGPGGLFVVRVLDANTFEIYEPFVLKKAVAKVATPSRAERFEFSPSGGLTSVALADTTIVVWDTAPWRKQIDELLTRELPADLASLWDDLAKDAATGLRAARLLGMAGDKAVALLAAKLPARKAADEARVKRWIAELDSSDFATREKAEKELRSLSGQVESQLREAMKSKPPLEVRRRIDGLLRDIDARTLTAAEVREVRAVQAMMWLNSAAARTLLIKWATGDPNATLTKAAKKACASH
jgi:RNA polymerase sigma factor (sigma-70 family)